MANFQRKTRDELEAIVLTNIAEYGWHAVNVIEDNGCPPWTFTIGLYETWQHPELIVIGRSRATSHAMLKTLADDIELNCEPDLRDTNPLVGMKCHYIEVNPRCYSDYVGFALWYYRKRKFPPLWPNADGLYPWDADASKPFKGNSF